VSDGASFLNVADGATKELKNILIRLRELAAQSSNGTFSNVQRSSLDKEAQALQAEYNRVIETTKFNGLSVFGGPVSIQAGAGGAAVLTVGVPMVTTVVGDGTFRARTSFAVVGPGPNSVALADVNGDGVPDLVTADDGSNTTSVLLGNGVTSTRSFLRPLSGVSVATRGAALAAQGRIDGYLNEVNLASGFIGVGLSRLTVASANLQSNIEATRAAEARITDADVAEESARLVSTGILQQAAAAVLSHADQEPALALKLLRP
jgi:flagellin